MLNRWKNVRLLSQSSSYQFNSSVLFDKESKREKGKETIVSLPSFIRHIKPI